LNIVSLVTYIISINLMYSCMVHKIILISTMELNICVRYFFCCIINQSKLIFFKLPNFSGVRGKTLWLAKIKIILTQSLFLPSTKQNDFSTVVLSNDTYFLNFLIHIFKTDLIVLSFFCTDVTVTQQRRVV